MEAYVQVYDFLKIRPAIVDCALGHIDPPIITMEAPAGWYGFPPALVPIWSEGSGPNYIGIWKHWFTERPWSFVQMYVGADRKTIEIARTQEQLLSVIAMMAIMQMMELAHPWRNFLEVLIYQI